MPVMTVEELHYGCVIVGGVLKTRAQPHLRTAQSQKQDPDPERPWHNGACAIFALGLQTILRRQGFEANTWCTDKKDAHMVVSWQGWFFDAEGVVRTPPRLYDPDALQKQFALTHEGNWLRQDYALSHQVTVEFEALFDHFKWFPYAGQYRRQYIDERVRMNGFSINVQRRAPSRP